MARFALFQDHEYNQFRWSLRDEAGYLVTERLWAGVSGRFQWTHDERYSPTLDSFDYGVGAYARYFVFERFFASAKWDWTSYETTTAWGGVGREGERLERSRRGRLRSADRSPEPLPLRSALRRHGRGARPLRYAVVTRFSFVMGI